LSYDKIINKTTLLSQVLASLILFFLLLFASTY